MAERLFTPSSKNREGAWLWLCSALGGEGLQLAGDFKAGETVTESRSAEGIGGVATRIVFRERSDGSELNWCGLPFRGDVVDVVFPGGERVDYSFDDLDAWATPRIAQNLASE